MSGVREGRTEAGERGSFRTEAYKGIGGESREKGRAQGKRERWDRLQPSQQHPPFLPAALIFDGSTNPAHPKHIGSIDPNCNVSEVVKGEPFPQCLARRGVPGTPPSLPGQRVTCSSVRGAMGLMLVVPSVNVKRTACWVGHPCPE